MAFDNSLGDDTATPIGTFSEIVEGTPAVTPANYINCQSGTKVINCFIDAFEPTKLIAISLF